MASTAVVDWRVWKAATVAADGPPIQQGASPVKKGDVLYVISTMHEPSQGQVNFITPSPVALALNIAIRAAKDANSAKEAIQWKEEGGAGWADTAYLSSLYAYFEHSMIAATFAFQSLEAFANQVIEQSLKGKMKLKRGKREVQWDAAEMERGASTEEKYGTVLPTLGKMPSPKGTKVWQNFARLREVRDGTIHLKQLNQYVSQAEDKETVYYHFLNTDPLDYPRWAIAMIRTFVPAGTDAWLIPAETLLN